MNLGQNDYTGMARIGETGCESTEWLSDSEIECLQAAGVFGTMRLAVTAGARPGTTTEALSYDVPSLTNSELTIVFTNGPTTGNEWIDVEGMNLGQNDYTGMARIGETGCESTEWLSDSEIECLHAAGVFGTMRLAVTAGARPGTTTEAFSFDSPSLDGTAIS